MTTESEIEDEIDIKSMSLIQSDDLLSDDLTNSGSEDEKKRKFFLKKKNILAQIKLNNSLETGLLSNKRYSFLISKTKMGPLNAAQLDIIRKLKTKQMASTQYVCSKGVNEIQNEDLIQNGSKKTVATQTKESFLRENLFS